MLSIGVGDDSGATDPAGVSAASGGGVPVAGLQAQRTHTNTQHSPVANPRRGMLDCTRSGLHDQGGYHVRLNVTLHE